MTSRCICLMLFQTTTKRCLRCALRHGILAQSGRSASNTKTTSLLLPLLYHCSVPCHCACPSSLSHSLFWHMCRRSQCMCRWPPCYRHLVPPAQGSLPPLVSVPVPIPRHCCCRCCYSGNGIHPRYRGMAYPLDISLCTVNGSLLLLVFPFWGLPRAAMFQGSAGAAKGSCGHHRFAFTCALPDECKTVYACMF